MRRWENRPALARELDAGNMPRHVGIIMDGNGRWAKARGLPRVLGHRAGVERLRDIVRATSDLGIAVISIYAFSSENWKRPLEEVQGLMGLLLEFLSKYIDELDQNGVRITFMGEREPIGPKVLEAMDYARSRTAENTGTVLNIAFNYGGRTEIALAARSLAQKALEGEIAPRDIDEKLLGAQLYTSGLPDPDVIIRTSGEQRLSNFMLYQCAYAEFVFVPVHWPDFDDGQYIAALQEYQRRTRRFGGL